MSFDIAAACLVITALLAYMNHRFVGLPTTIGVMAIALLLSLGVLGLDTLGLDHGLRQYEESLLLRLDFSDVLMQGMLSLLLFAGALHVDLSALKRFRWQVAFLAALGTIASTFLIGFGMYLLLPWVGLPLPLLYCLLFGALISPTDPIAVMSILQTAGAPKTMETVIAGESLFNDGVGVVIFSLLLGILASGTLPSVREGATLILREAGGGIVFGWILGYVTFRLIKSIDQYEVEVMLTLAAVMGGYALASHLHVSGPLAMVIAGLMIGNGGRAEAMSDTTRRYIDMFWELLDGMLNAVLFVLLGMEALLLNINRTLLWGGLAAVIVTLVVRALTVGVPVAIAGRRFGLPKGSWSILTWGGLRGGISVALAFSMPAGSERDAVLTLTYCVVVFAILAQGLTFGRLVRRVTSKPSA